MIPAILNRMIINISQEALDPARWNSLHTVAHLKQSIEAPFELRQLSLQTVDVPQNVPPFRVEVHVDTM